MKKIFETLDIFLTDFKKNENVLLAAFEDSKNLGCPIKNILELGVYRMSGEGSSGLPGNPALQDLPGQSTKIFMILNNFFDIDKFVSLDIDNCMSTINRCKQWVESFKLKVEKHKFVQSNSIKFDVKSEFESIDLILLDTNHDDVYPETLGYMNSGGAGMTYKELSYYLPYLSRDGRMFIHDTKNFYTQRKYGYNTIGAIHKLMDENPDLVFVEYNTNNNGLGELFWKDALHASVQRKSELGVTVYNNAKDVGLIYQ